jgi:hypothetical protein
MSVTSSFINNGVAGTAEFDSIEKAMVAAVRDANARRVDPEHPVEPVSVDDHQGNAYDADTITRMVSPMERFLR